MPRFYALDSLRGIAAVSVVIFHYQFDFFGGVHSVAWPFPKGYLAVDLFFVLSGVVLAYRYGNELRDRASSIGSFMFARLSRLYPLHVATLLFVVGTAISAGTWGKSDFGGGSTPTYALLLNLLLIQCIGLLPSATFNIVSWSISTELVVNGLYAVTARHSPKGFAHGLMALVAIAALAMLIAAPGLPHYFGVIYESAFGVAAGLLRCIFGFMIGVLFYRLVIATRLHERVRGLTAIGAASALFLVVHAAAYGFGLTSYNGLDYVIVAVDFPLLLFVAMVAGSPLNLLLRAPPLHFLGIISYSIYLLHYPMHIIMQPLKPYLPEALLVRPGSGLTVLVLTIAASVVSYLVIERGGRIMMLK